MKLYADTPARRTGQVVVDLFVLAWVVLWVRAAMAVHDATLRLAAPGRQLESAGTGLSATCAARRTRSPGSRSSATGCRRRSRRPGARPAS